MPRILRIINRFNLGGPTYNAAYLTKYLSPDFQTLLVGGEKEDAEESSEFILDELGVERERIPEMRRKLDPLKDRAVLKKLRALIREFRPDIVHTHASKAGALGRWAGIKEKVPLLFHTFHGHVFHSYFGSWSTRSYKGIERYLAKKSTRLIALSEEQKRELTQEHRICPPEKVEVVPLGFELARFREKLQEKRHRFRQRWDLDEDELAIGIIGRLVPVKGHDLFLEAIAELKKRSDRKLRGVIVGDGECRERLMEKARSLGLSVAGPGGDDFKVDVLFTSWIRSVDEVHAGVDIAALSSHNEGTPVSLIEAQAAGLPVVSTEVGGVASIVADGDSGRLLKERNAGLFADALEELSEDPDLRAEWGARGWEQVRERFSAERLANDMKGLYWRELGQHPD